MPADKSANDDCASTGELALGAAEPNRYSSRDAQLCAALLGTIEGEIVPRLLMVASATRSATGPRDHRRNDPQPADVAEFARLLVTHGPGVASAYIDALHQRGTPFDRICLELLAPTARHIVALWEQQGCDDAQLRGSLNALHVMLMDVRGAARRERHGARHD